MSHYVKYISRDGVDTGEMQLGLTLFGEMMEEEETLVSEHVSRFPRASQDKLKSLRWN